MIAKERTVWMCSDCGHEQIKWTGSCHACNKWNTLVEERIAPSPLSKFQSVRQKVEEPRLIQEIDRAPFDRIQSKESEIDRLFGGGVVVGSLNLIGGEPGIGKSTLLLQLSKQFARQGHTVLYVCGEESIEQTSIRAKRLLITDETIYLLSETVFSNIRQQVKKVRPTILVIDSIQIVYKSELPSAPGSVVQVKEIAMECMHLAKGAGITTFVIGHVTKSGDIAGPRVLEHIVDTVFEFEGDRQHGYRLMRSVKNRFGPTDDVALFQMGEKGLSAIQNPSSAFLEERSVKTSGSAIVPTIEGTRPLLVEVQALVAPSSYPTPSRRATGMDHKRLTLLLAVLEKRMGYQLHSLDVFVSVAGGIKIVEPAIDLAAMMAIASSYCNKPLPPHTVILGEVGLGGEVRTVTRIESRLREAHHMGFKEAFLPKKYLARETSLSTPLKLHPVESVEGTIGAILS